MLIKQMNCTFKDPNQIKKIIGALADGLETLNMNCSAGGIKVAATNMSHTDMRELTLTSDWFDTYSCTRDCTMGVHMPTLKKFMSTAGDKDTIKWTHDPVKALLKIEIEEAGDNKGHKEWKLKLIDFDEEALAPPPNPAFTVSFRVATVLVHDWVTNAKILSGDFCIGVEKDKHINISGVGDAGEMHLKQPLPSVMATVFNYEPDFTTISMTMSIKEAEHLDVMIKCAPGVDIQLDNGLPVCATSYLDETRTSFIRLWIAPKLNEDDDD